MTTERSKTASALQNRHIQLMLILSGLRGAVSFSLVESLPIYNAVTNEGTKYKGILKAMTSASILFTIFILGGSSFYILKYLDIKSWEKGMNTHEQSTRTSAVSVDETLEENGMPS
jgi:NhaP-type Na+/H+ or K+/H+ antiporter